MYIFLILTQGPCPVVCSSSTAESSSSQPLHRCKWVQQSVNRCTSVEKPCSSQQTRSRRQCAETGSRCQLIAVTSSLV